MDISAIAEGAATSGDAALIAHARQGDKAAFDALVRPRLDRCYRLAWSILLNDADAADAVQDAFVSAWRQLPRLRDTNAFDGWLNRIVANTARMSRRRRVRLREVQVRPLAADAQPAEPPPDSIQSNEIERIADIDAIGRAFGRLRDHERAILALHYVDGRPMAEIAKALAIPVGTAKSRLHTARRALEQAMEVEA